MHFYCQGISDSLKAKEETKKKKKSLEGADSICNAMAQQNLLAGGPAFGSCPDGEAGRHLEQQEGSSRLQAAPGAVII